MLNPKSILILGNFLSGSTHIRGVGEDLSVKLIEHEWVIFTASSQKSRILRLAEMLFVLAINRRRYYVACVEVYSGLAFVWAEICCQMLRALGKPYAITLHGGNLPAFYRRWPWRVQRLLRSAEVVTTPSTLIKSTFSSIRGDIILLRNAVELNQYTYHLRTHPRPKLVWLRAFHSIYSPKTAVEALAPLVDDFPDIELTMFGPDKEDGSLTELQQRAKQLDVTGHIHIPGPIRQSDVPQKLGDFDIFLNTTTAESFGVSVVEAAALGMCIVTTNVGELPYIWSHEHDALLVPPNEPQAMADAIRRILTEPGLAERLSRNARKTAEQFDWSIILPQWEALLTDVIEKHARG